MRILLAFVATTTFAGLLASADCAFAQQPGRLRVAIHLADSRSGVTYPGVKKLLTITAEAAFPVYRVETGRDGTSEITLPPGVYVVKSAGRSRSRVEFIAGARGLPPTRSTSCRSRSATAC